MHMHTQTHFDGQVGGMSYTASNGSWVWAWKETNVQISCYKMSGISVKTCSMNARNDTCNKRVECAVNRYVPLLHDALALQAADLYMLSIPKVGVIYLERDGNTSLTSCIMPICHVCPVLVILFTPYTLPLMYRHCYHENMNTSVIKRYSI